jgi:hypothetical protein
MESGLKCPIRPYNGYSVLKLDKDDNTFKATLLSWSRARYAQGSVTCEDEDEWVITGRRVVYDQTHVIYDFHIYDGDRVNYVIIRDEGLLADIGDEAAFILGDK